MIFAILVAVNGRWSPWSSWSSCSVTCGVGMKERTRRCNNPVPSSFGQACIGDSEDKEICNLNNCPLSVRLVNGPHAFEGRLEVYHDGQWGTVCDDNFGNYAAKVVCTMLNFPGDANLAQKYSSAPYGKGTLPILLDDVSCTGSELSIFDCSHRAWGSNDCGHGEDVGVVCHTSPVRLVDGPHMYEGRLEAYNNGEWGTVCDDSFNDNAARVVCRMLNFPGLEAHAFSSAPYGQGSVPIRLDDVSCDGSESSIFDCSHSTWGSNNCGHSEDVGVSCVSGLLVRLAGGGSYSGRVEVSLDGSNWGTVCNDDINNNGAKVVCRMLGLPLTNPTVYTAGGGSGNIYLDNVICIGSESNLLSCDHNHWLDQNCDHDEDIGVRCPS
ncbi:neurotrypsin-like [Mercenaria mercenaria]|uniref:neurotrypsin-like n=1 Tax=Mercenaria mercenaria TaxID=6596 RepID=UPI00234EB987|nr:neurotrypsin-like [Mercenaria mercenaria]